MSQQLYCMANICYKKHKIICDKHFNNHPVFGKYSLGQCIFQLRKLNLAWRLGNTNCCSEFCNSRISGALLAPVGACSNIDMFEKIDYLIKHICLFFSRVVIVTVCGVDVMDQKRPSWICNIKQRKFYEVLVTTMCSSLCIKVWRKNLNLLSFDVFNQFHI